jgi:gamma-glutamyltranspeptidase/glutathione hydrolase
MRRLFAILLVCVLCAQPAQTAAPAPISSQNGMVVSAHRLASQAGIEVLKDGGNAIDAAIAVAYALAVTFPEAGNLGGGGFMTIRLADGTERFIDFRETAPGLARADLFLDETGKVIEGLSTRGWRAVAVPGTVAGLELARRTYARLPRARLMAPAISLAREGFVLDAGDAGFLASGAEDFARDKASAAIFLNKGQPWKAGERLIQKDLARTLTFISREGAKGFYTGDIAARIVAASRAGGGILTLADLAAYQAVERAPLTCDYRGYRIISAPPPSSGGMVICQTLGVLSGFPMDSLGFHSAQSVHLTVEALRRAFYDRNTQLGDPAFVDVDAARLISPEYVAARRALIDPEKATPSLSLGRIGSGREGMNTTHLSVVDRHGNAVSLTYTINDWFGARVTAGGVGILMNNEMDDFTSKPGVPNMFGLVEGPNNAIAPGKRPLSSMSPTIITKDNELFMVIGTPGGSRIPTALVQVISNVIDHGMTITEAVNAPRFHAQWLPDVVYSERHGLSADTLALLSARGHEIEPMPYWNQVAAILVGAPGVGRDPEGEDRYYGALDPRLPTGSVEGY